MNCGSALSQDEVTNIKSGVPIFCRYCDHTITIDPYRKQPEQEPFVYPTGTIEIRQKVLPLDIEIQRFGGARADDDGDDDNGTLEIRQKVIPQDEELETDDYFARAQFQEMADAEKLTSPAFDKLNSGVSVKVCPHCNHKNEVGNCFCDNCGASI